MSTEKNKTAAQGWRTLPAKLRERAFFTDSADNSNLLARLSRKLADALRRDMEYTVAIWADVFRIVGRDIVKILAVGLLSGLALGLALGCATRSRPRQAPANQDSKQGAGDAAHAAYPSGANRGAGLNLGESGGEGLLDQESPGIAIGEVVMPFGKLLQGELGEAKFAEFLEVSPGLLMTNGAENILHDSDVSTGMEGRQ